MEMEIESSASRIEAENRGAGAAAAEDEEDVCRICRTSGEDGSPLYYPCACSGSIKYVHQECLLQWLNHSNAKQCEVCKHQFSFSPVYAEDAPTRLPVTELVYGMVAKAGRGLRFFSRLVLVLSVWLLFIPFTTFWIWRMTFVRGLGDAQKLFVTRFLTPAFLFADCLNGFLISAGIVFIFLGATSLREYFRHIREVAGQEADRQQQAPPANGDGGAGQGQGLAAGAGEIIRRNAENVAARIEAHVEQMFEADDPDGAEDVPFDELVGMQGPIHHLIENAVTVLASNAIFLGIVAFVPFTIGRIFLSVLNLGKAPARSEGPVEVVAKAVAVYDAMAEVFVTAIQLSDAATVAVGYGVIFLLLSFYLGLILLVRYGRGEPLMVGRIRGVVSVAEAAPSLFRHIIGCVRYVATMLKVAFLLVIELGVFPLVCGWWLDVCTLAMLKVSFAQRVAFFWASPLTSSLLHWLVGIFYMLQISIFVSLLREVLRPGVLYFLRDPADPNYNPFRDLIDDPLHKHARRVLLSVVVYGSLIVLLVFVPVQVATHLAFSVFPLDIRVSDPFTELPADMLLFHICIPFALEHFRPRATIKAVLFYWFSVVGKALDLYEYLLPRPEDTNRGNGNAVAEQAAPPPAANGETNADEERLDTGEYKFAVRIVLLLLGAWLTMLVFNSSLIVLPVSVGRAIVTSFSRLPITRGANCNDLYAFNIGCFVIWAAAAAVRYIVNYLRTHDMWVLFMQVLKWSAIVSKSVVLLSLWVIVIPVLIGLLFELLVVVPLRVPVDESPVFLLYQDWALGLVLLKIWTRLAMAGQATLLTDESWRRKFEQVKADGFSRLRGWWVFQEIVAPVLVKLLTALSIPYVAARGLFPALGLSILINSAVYRFAWAGSLMLLTGWYGLRQLRQLFLDVHNAIRDDRYLIGKRLHNYGEPSKALVAAEEEKGGSSDGEATADGAGAASPIATADQALRQE
ncbi:probable E3 ubiquitin ligase SUD1 [Selaginella moellendorffii]|uniref:probable E3 ubiquitin ligase SUD1 n=1 Tax=Selaginella moellendorffii TaxID=88036 RepID=UPI000D1C6D10|nr:probable E3 ubiquitin ligase SUD1 [Selaginella moellendorffii]|eukprot:XP_024527152.1 probable E3 ubiquitin ligase SUD1 [Selaginella moellendorffii]